MDVTINLASQPYQQVQRFLLRWKMLLSAVAVLAFVLLAASTGAFFSWRTTHKQVAELRQKIAEQDRLREDAETFLNQPGNRQVRLRAQFLNAAIARKAFSWTEVFTDLEHVMPPRLRVASIHPEVNGDGQLELHLVVVGSARQAAIELVRRLEASPHFAQAQIRDEATQNPQSSGESVRYTITALYIPRFARQDRAREKEQAQTAAAPLEVASGNHVPSTEASSAGH